MAANRVAATSDPITKNVRAVAALEGAAARQRSRFVQMCDRVTQVAGSTTSIAVHLVWFATWVGWNTLQAGPFDPFPFSLLTTVVSLEAIFLSLFVLASQSRLTIEADRRAQLDLQVNLLAENEMTLVLRMLRDLCHAQQVGVPAEVAAAIQDMDVAAVAEAVDREFPADACAGPDTTPAPDGPT